MGKGVSHVAGDRASTRPRLRMPDAKRSLSVCVSRMQSTTTESTAAHSQWLFPISSLAFTPTAQERSLHEEMYDRSRGIEFLYRLGTSIGLFVCLIFSPPLLPVHVQPLSPRSHSPGLFTAATWFHRFFMRNSMVDYHRQVSLFVPHLVTSDPVTNTSLDHRGCLHISRYEDRRVRKEAQGRS